MEIGTPQEINAKPGDVIKCIRHKYTQYDTFIPGKEYTVDEDGLVQNESGIKRLGNCAVWRIVSRASDDIPKLWRDMTDAEKGALLLAHHEGEAIQLWHSRGGWVESVEFGAVEDIAYRVKPEPVQETFTHEQWVSMHRESDRGKFSLLFGPARPDDDVKGQTTIETVDGKPVRVVWEADSQS